MIYVRSFASKDLTSQIASNSGKFLFNYIRLSPSFALAEIYLQISENDCPQSLKVGKGGGAIFKEQILSRIFTFLFCLYICLITNMKLANQ